MKKFRLANIRSFREDKEITLDPVTILVGQNSSGKSTLLRFFPLMRQSADVRTREPLLWVGHLADFGSATIAAARMSNQEPFGVDVSFYSDNSIFSVGRRMLYLRETKKRSRTPIKVSVRYIPPLEGKKFEFSMKFGSDSIRLTIQNGTVVAFTANEFNLTDIIDGQLASDEWTACFPNLADSQKISISDNFFGEIYKFVRTKKHGKSSAERIHATTLSIFNSPLESLLTIAKNNAQADSGWKKATAQWDETSNEYRRLRANLIGARLLDLIESASTTFRRLCSEIRYIAPIRASAERYYRRQGIALKEIDAFGGNVALYIENMSETTQANFSNWVFEIFGFKISTTPSEGHISLMISTTETSNQDPVNVADTGFGYSQIIPVLLQLWNAIDQHDRTDEPRIVAIEQPELHLHPKLQAKLADAFSSAVLLARSRNIDLRLVIETHSEQLISRIGRLVANEKISAADVSILILEKSGPNNETRIKSTKFNSDGIIEKWPYGFFD